MFHLKMFTTSFLVTKSSLSLTFRMFFHHSGRATSSQNTMSQQVGAEVVHPIKITVVGDGAVGKTSLIRSYNIGRHLPEQCIEPTIDCTRNLEVDGLKFSLSLWDTAGQEEYKKLRPLSYPNTDCFVLCYAVDNNSSFANVKTQWMPELREHCPKPTVILVGTKADLITPENPHCITEQEGQKLKSKIKANAFMLCSAKTLTNVDEVFLEAVRVVIQKEKAKQCQLV